MKDIVIMGMQGAGKGMQSKLLLEHFGNQIKYFDAGGMLRVLKSSPNDIGKYISSRIDQGMFVPDTFMIKLFELFLMTVEPGEFILLDGFPRKPEETEGFLKIMEAAKRDFAFVVLDINKETAVERLSNRRLCKQCNAILNCKLHDFAKGCPHCGCTEIYQRTDDQNMAAIETRLAWYETLFVPTLKSLESFHLVKHIDGNQAIEKVFSDILEVIK